jgi:hypothetical protein
VPYAPARLEHGKPLSQTADSVSYSSRINRVCPATDSTIHFSLLPVSSWAAPTIRNERAKGGILRRKKSQKSDHLPFTQEFLAEMLGVRRTSVTTVARTLQEAGMVKYTRGKIEILDVEGLREAACECYETTKWQYRQLLPGP